MEVSDGEADVFEDDMVEVWDAKVAWGGQMADGRCRLVISKRLQEVARGCKSSETIGRTALAAR